MLLLLLPAPAPAPEEEEEEEEEAVFIRGVNTNEDPPNAHQAQHRPVQATGAMGRRRLSLLVKIEGDPLKTQHAQHRSVQATDR